MSNEVKKLPTHTLRCADLGLDLRRPHVMGILNVTPDSFSDGGELLRERKVDMGKVLRRADAMVKAGASILDVGGESTRPGAEPVSSDEELARVIPVVEALRARIEVVVSVDSSNAAVIKEAAPAGAGMINDVRALTRPGALQAAAASGLPVCLMHMQGEPGSMQQSPHYEDVVAEVRTYLLERAEACRGAGIGPSQILLDPGFGFGKTLAHNLELLQRLPEVAAGLPLLVGMSRKSMIDKVLGRALDERLPASLALALIAVQKGASIVRVHDVAETVDVIKMWQAVEAGKEFMSGL